MIARRGDYGFDAPYVPVMMALGSLPLLVGAAVKAMNGDLGGLLTMGLSGLFLLGCAASYVFTTRWGKFLAWDEVLTGLGLRGDEQVLDVGCGRGAVLLLAAQHVPRGKAIGIDLWQRQDQSGNGLDATTKNAGVEGVAERVELHTGDMRELPFKPEQFDLVVSSLAIHNVPDAPGRAKAIREIVRVLKPGGRVALADFRYSRDAAQELSAAGMVQVTQRGMGLRFWYGGPWAATTLVTGTKPSA